MGDPTAPTLHDYTPLTPEEEEKLALFKDKLTKADLYHNGDVGDITLIRFLRARKFDLTGAQKQFSATAEWRRKNDVDNIFATFDVDEMENARKFYPRWVGRRDKSGRPIYVYHLASLASVQKELDSVPTERRYQRIIVLYEAMNRLITPLCTYLPHPPAAGTPIYSVTTIIDFKDVSISSLWSFRNHLAEASRLATANYPETLNVIAVVNSPSFFPTVWGWIKIWFDPGTRDKIFVLGNDPGSTLRQLIDPESLPIAYGGELEWVFRDEPNLDEEEKKIVGDKLPRGPMVFVDGKVIPALPS